MAWPPPFPGAPSPLPSPGLGDDGQHILNVLAELVRTQTPTRPPRTSDIQSAQGRKVVVPWTPAAEFDTRPLPWTPILEAQTLTSPQCLVLEVANQWVDTNSSFGAVRLQTGRGEGAQNNPDGNTSNGGNFNYINLPPWGIVLPFSGAYARVSAILFDGGTHIASGDTNAVSASLSPGAPVSSWETDATLAQNTTLGANVTVQIAPVPFARRVQIVVWNGQLSVFPVTGGTPIVLAANATQTLPAENWLLVSSAGGVTFTILWETMRAG